MVNPKPRKRGRVAHVEHETDETIDVPKSNHFDQPIESLRRYIERYELPIGPPMTLQGFLVHQEVGKYSETGKTTDRSSCYDAYSAVNDHLRAGTIKEGEGIAEFLYSIQHQNDTFKRPFVSE